MTFLGFFLLLLLYNLSTVLYISLATMSAVSGPVPTSIAPLGGVPRQQRAFKTQDKPDEVRRSNMNAAKAVSDAIRTSLGPKGMDKMVSVDS